MKEIVIALVNSLKYKIGEEWTLNNLICNELGASTIDECIYKGDKLSELDLIKIAPVLIREAKLEGIKLISTDKKHKDMLLYTPFIVSKCRKKSRHSIDKFNQKLFSAEKIQLYVGGYWNPYAPIEITFDGEAVYRKWEEMLSLTGIEPVWFEMENSLPYCVKKA